MSIAKPRVVIESPYANEHDFIVRRNIRYARLCVFDSLHRGEAPFASHLIYTQPGVLDDGVLSERQLGLDAGFEFAKCCDMTALYVDFGISRGMMLGQAAAELAMRPVQERRLSSDALDHLDDESFWERIGW